MATATERMRYLKGKRAAKVVSVDEAFAILEDEPNPVIYHPTEGTLSGWRARYSPIGQVPAWSVKVAGREERVVVRIEDLTDICHPRPVVFATDFAGESAPVEQTVYPETA